MTRILTWLTATLAVLAFITYYQANLAGGAERGHDQTRAACGVTRLQTTAGQRDQTESPAARDANAPGEPSGADGAGDPCSTSDHSGEPGESK
jgi:hypothetical protein